MMSLVVSSLLLSAAALLTEVVVQAQTGGGAYYDCAFSAPLQLDQEVRLEHFKNTNLGTYTMRLIYTGGLGWVSIGINSEGGSKMVPAKAVIGRIEYDDDEITPIGSSVLKYDLLTDDRDASGVIPMADELQTLMDATFEQSEDGTTSILTFTQKLDDVGLEAAGPITDLTSWIYAIGLPDNQWDGKHTVHGSFYLPLEENCVTMNIKTPQVITDTEETEVTNIPPDEEEHDTDPDESSVGNVDDVQDPEPEEQPTAAEPESEEQPTAAEPEPEEQPTAAEPEIYYECSYVEPREIYVGKVNLEHFKNSVAGTYTMRLTYTGGDAWVSIGVNHAGSYHMAPSTCIIGRIEFDEDGITPIGSSVLKYDVTSTKKDASGVVAMADEYQTLMDATFEQNGETSVLTFTQWLDDSGMHAPITDESSWIFAMGLRDNQWDGQHKVHGSLFLPLEDNCVVKNDGNPVASIDGSKSGSGFVMRQDSTKATFPLWVAHGWFMAIAWGLVGPLAIGAGILRRLVGSNWFKIHFYLNMMCVVMTIVGFALAVAAVNMEGKPHFTRKTSQDDYKHVHHNAGLAIFIIVILQSVAGYFRPPAAPAPAVAPATVEKEAKQLDDDAGDKPNFSLHRAETRNTEGETIHGKVSFESNGNSTPEAIEAPRVRLSPSNETSADLEDSQDTPEVAAAPAQPKPKSPWVRKMWEMQHRLTGAVVVGLAWYNCHSGYQLMEDKYDETQDFTVLFWSVTGAIAGSIFILAYVARV